MLNVTFARINCAIFVRCLVAFGLLWPICNSARIVAKETPDQEQTSANKSNTVVSSASAATGISWKAIVVDSRFRSEGVAVADCNRDGLLDVLVGEFWYEAPDWLPHEIYTPGEYGNGESSYSSAFLCYTDDINQDSWPDLIVIGFPGTECHWYQNPQGQDVHWRKNTIWHSACNETPLYVDLFGTGRPVLVMAWQPPGEENMGQMAWFEPNPGDVTAPWTMHPISQQSTESMEVPGTHRYSHGLGVGDVNGDARLDVLCTGGWWEQPEHASKGFWEFHASKLGDLCANMHVDDLDADGIVDVLSSSAHSFGIWRHAGRRMDGKIAFVTKELFPQLISQTHALMYVDLDGNGLRDLVTGKRWWAHGPMGDPGSDMPSNLYWFAAEKDENGDTQFTPKLIHGNSGVGLQFVIEDMNSDRLLDVIVSNKKGVFIHQQLRQPAN